jgi:hypothetical protein
MYLTDTVIPLCEFPKPSYQLTTILLPSNPVAIL